MLTGKRWVPYFSKGRHLVDVLLSIAGLMRGVRGRGGGQYKLDVGRVAVFVE